MDDLNRYIEFRYENWADYARHMSRMHKFEGWEYDLLNECLTELLKKQPEKLHGMLSRKTRKIVNGTPTTEIDKFILKMMHVNAFSQVAPFRKNILGNKIISRNKKRVQTLQTTELNGHDISDEPYNHEYKDQLDAMHTHNISRLKNNGFGAGAEKLYQVHYIEGKPLAELSETEQDHVREIEQFLITSKTLLDD